jgi:uncharacterized protein
MELTFLYSPGFVKAWDRHRLSDLDLVASEQLIAKNPAAAPVMKGTGGLRKVRFAPPSLHKGMSRAARVGFAYFKSKSAVIVVAMLMKNDAANFSAAERAEIAKWLKLVEGSFR